MAATLKLRDRLRGQNIVNVISGANLDTATLVSIFTNTAL